MAMAQFPGINPNNPSIPNIPIPPDLDGLKNMFLDYLDWIVPINETCKTLYQMMEAGNKKKLYIVCGLLVICGLKIALIGERFKISTTAILILFTVTFGGAHILESVFNFALESLQKFHSNNPVIYFLIQLVLAFILSFCIHKFLINFIRQIAAAVIIFLIYRKVDSLGWFNKLPTEKRIIYIIIIMLVAATVLYLLLRYLVRALTIAAFSIYGVVYTFIGGSVFIYILSDRKYAYGPEDIRECVMNVASYGIICSIIMSFLIQFFYPLLSKKKR